MHLARFAWRTRTGDSSGVVALEALAAMVGYVRSGAAWQPAFDGDLCIC